MLFAFLHNLIIDKDDEHHLSKYSVDHIFSYLFGYVHPTE